MTIQDSCPPVDETPSDSSGVQVEHLDIRNSAAAARWDEAVASHPDCGPFHGAAWGRAIVESYGHRPHYLCCTANGQVAAAIPLVEIRSRLTGRRGICLPFSDACGPVVFRAAALEALSAELRRLAQANDWKYVEVRQDAPIDSGAESAAEFYRHYLLLPGNIDEALQTFGAGTRGAVRQALKTNLNVELLTSVEAVAEYFRLHLRTRKRHGAPSQPFKFFRAIHSHLISAGLGFVALARLENRSVAGAIFLRFGRRAVYKFAASDPAASRLRANNLVLFEGIRALIRSGCELLDFGRTSLNNPGLRAFKLSWGTKEEMIRYYRLYRNRTAAVGSRLEVGTFQQRVFQHLPLTLNRLTGALVYPHID